MTRDDIIRMARESADQSPREDWNTNTWVFGEEALERFFHAAYAAGADAEREKITSWVALQRNDVPATGFEIASAIRARGEK